MLLRLPRQVAVLLIGIYQRTLSPDHGPLRRFFPGGFCEIDETCSQYGKRVIRENGVIKGGWKAAKRILACR